MVKKYKQFLFEWGYGGEGGVASKDPIKVRSAMLTEIDPIEAREEEEEEDNTDIPILSDANESVDNDNDPYGEENWEENLPSYSYMSWDNGIYSFLKQLKNSFIDECLAGLERVEQKDAEEWLDDIRNEIDDGDYNFSSEEIRAIRDDIDDLLELCVDNEDDDDRDEGPDPDEYYDRKREEEHERWEREYEDK